MIEKTYFFAFFGEMLADVFVEKEYAITCWEGRHAAEWIDNVNIIR